MRLLTGVILLSALRLGLMALFLVRKDAALGFWWAHIEQGRPRVTHEARPREDLFLSGVKAAGEPRAGEPGTLSPRLHLAAPAVSAALRGRLGAESLHLLLKET